MASADRRRGRWFIASLAGFAVVSLSAGIVLGPLTVPLRDAVISLVAPQDDSLSAVHRVIVRQIRAPRTLVGFLVGCALAVSGVAMQGLFRNPLASPYVLGVASGASTGAALVILRASGTTFLLPLGAFGGAAAAVVVVYGLARGRDRRTSIFTLILAGVAVGALFSAVTRSATKARATPSTIP